MTDEEKEKTLRAYLWGACIVVLVVALLNILGL